MEVIQNLHLSTGAVNHLAVTSYPVVVKYYKYTVLSKIATETMESDGHYSNGTRYGANEIIAYAGGRHGSLGAAFLDSPIAQSLKSLVYGKTVLDIGCGVGDWCSLVAQCGAKSVHGFDIQEEMVELAKQATSHLDNVYTYKLEMLQICLMIISNVSCMY